MSATNGFPTWLPSNAVTPDPKLALNPNWTPNETSVPQANIYVEDGNARIMIVAGKSPKVSDLAGSVGALGYTSSFGDGTYNEEVAIFRMTNINVQQCTALQLESASIYFPGVDMPDPGKARNLENGSLCSGMVDDTYFVPRRLALNQVDMQIPVLIRNVMYHFSIESFLPHGRKIAYYSIVEMLNYFITAWESFMHNEVGDATFHALTYVDSAGPRLYWTSTNFGLNNIRLFLPQMEDRMTNFLQILTNFVGFTNLRVGDTSQDPLGYAEGESLGFYARTITPWQNNCNTLTLHCNELTQFRKSDSIAPIEGMTLIGCSVPNAFYGGGKDGGTYTFTEKLGTLVSPKIAFDRSQTVTEFLVSLRVFQGTHGQALFLSPTELQQAVLTLIFRLW